MLVEKVVRGSGLGKSFGFPTANLDISNFDYENNQGVYAGYAILKKIFSSHSYFVKSK